MKTVLPTLDVIEKEHLIGQQIADILGIKKNRKGRYQTSCGDKTAVGIYNTILTIAEKIKNNKPLL